MGGWFGSSRQIDIAEEIDAIRADLGHVAQRVGRIASGVTDNMRQSMPSTRRTQDQFAGVFHDAADRGRGLLHTAESEVSQGLRQARGSVERNPVVSLAIAAGIGFLIGLATRPR